jgi:hypothetical protein
MAFYALFSYATLPCESKAQEETMLQPQQRLTPLRTLGAKSFLYKTFMLGYPLLTPF